MHHREFNLIDAIRLLLLFSVAAMIIPLSFKLAYLILRAVYRGVHGLLAKLRVS